MEKYYKKNVDDLKIFRASINTEPVINVDESLDKIKKLMKEWFDGYTTQKNKDINETFKEQIKGFQNVSQNINKQLVVITENLQQMIEKTVYNLEDTIEKNVANRFAKMNSEFLNELLTTQKELNESFNNKVQSYYINSQHNFTDFSDKFTSLLHNLVPYSEFNRLQTEFYTQMADVKLPQEKMTYVLGDADEVTEYMLLESSGVLTDNGKLIVIPSTYESKCIIGTHNNNNILDDSRYQNVLLIDTTPLNIGDYITTSQINGFGQKYIYNNWSPLIIGQLVTKVNWMNMKELDGNYYNTGVGLCKLF